MSPSASQHDTLHEAAQWGLGIWVAAQQGLLQKGPPHLTMIERLIRQKLQQALQAQANPFCFSLALLRSKSCLELDAD